MAIVGWDDDEQAVILRNSWGEDGGMFGNGTCYLYCKYTDILDRASSIYGLIPPATTPTDDNKEEEKVQDDVQVVRTLRLTSPYMSGDDVKHAQERLNIHGAKLTVDGIFGKNTYIATREFQAAQGLTIDGIIGKKTLAALDADPKVEPVKPVVDEELRKDFISYLYKQIGNIYCWGGNGEDASESAINSMENSSANKTRAKNFLAKQKKAGVQNIKMYDCSGLISRWLQDHGLAKKKRNCDHLWSMCTAVQKTELEACDLLFRGTDGDKTHVGVYVGNGMVIESRGRDYGVVIRPIDETAGYWQYFGRLNVI
jgi:cell wall-associated NlpC family hydrolase